MELTPRAQECFTVAASIAEQVGVDKIGAEHLQLALLQDEDSIPYQVLDAEYDADLFRKNLSSYLEREGYKQPTNRASLLPRKN